MNTFRVWLQNGGMMSDSSESDGEYHSWSRQQKIKRHRDGRSANTIRPESETEDSSSDDSDDNVIHSKLGQIFSDEESVTEDSSDEHELLYDTEGYVDDSSEDEKDYEMWKRYQREEF